MHSTIKIHAYVIGNNGETVLWLS